MNISFQGVAKLPFIDVNLLLSATKVVEKDLAVKQCLTIYTSSIVINVTLNQIKS
jgi:5'-3' exonuclease